MTKFLALCVTVTCLFAPGPLQAQDPAHGTHAPATGAPQQPAGGPTGSQPPSPGADTDNDVDHAAHQSQQQQTPNEPIPPLSDADRAAAFPAALEGHAVHDRAINYFILFDQFEWQAADEGGVNWDNKTWVGGDLNRLWVRAEGESAAGAVENAFVDILWGRSFSRWWDMVGGIRQDFRPGSPQTWFGAGIQGLAPYWFEVEATAYVGAEGRTHARFEVEYELLMTNRLILQPLIEAEIYGKSDPERGIGAGLTTLETGFRMRYELRREFAPYVGVAWNRKFGSTRSLAAAAGEETAGARLLAGLRLWL